MQQKIADHNPTSLENLKEVTINVWVNEITRDNCKKHARSMPKRISAVLRAKGQPSKYWLSMTKEKLLYMKLSVCITTVY